MQEPTYKVIEIFPLQQGESKRGPWKSQDVIVEAIQNVQYPDRFLLTLHGELTSQLNKLLPDDIVVASWAANVREWTTREGKRVCSQQNNCWRIEHAVF